ncbi:transcription initiation factor TFIID subunit 3 isoform X3 [Zootermopsis nevadensis]|uniref:transcription initiation factor TFIID subunit 3 isoform X3 n=1 Tax=Zootermopsis nevadensis TaxID=136037 RepID=UPI000B8EC40E|nr:transcription initiation factor TFIID subunit 3 isoform X3 [Zootermopsis nevadensis]
MAETFSRNALKMVVAQMCQTIGWHGIHNTPLDIMIDVLQRYMAEVGKLMHRYSEQFGHTVPNLDDVGLTFRDMGINLLELEEYIRNVDSVPCVYEIPKYPIPRDSHLNFLKPGSREVVTRPVHVHEHLPPMHPEMEEEEYGNKQVPLSVDTASSSGATSPLASPKGNVFKRPGDPISVESPAVKRARLMLEEEGRPLREISSVMMTTSGFLSPAREGKLPESRTPLQPSDSRSNSPQPTSYPMVPPEVKGDKKTKKLPFKKTIDGIKKIGDKENKKKDNKLKDLIKVEKHVPTDESKVKKLVSMKELSKLKALKSGALKMMAHAGSTSGPSTNVKPPKLSPPKITAVKSPNLSTPKTGKPVAQVKTQKTEKIFPLPVSVPQQRVVTPEKCKDIKVVEGKLSSEPDKQKLNIFKKISKVKEEKPEKLEKVERIEHFEPPPRDSRESSPGLVIDESEANSRQREARMAQIDDCIESVIQRSMEIVEEEPKLPKERKSPLSHVAESSSSKVDETINDVVSGHTSGPGSDHDVYMFDDDLSPPGTPSTPRTPELPTPRKVQDQKERKRKKDKSKSKKDSKGKSLKGSVSPKKIKMELPEPVTPDRPKTPEALEPRDQPLAAPVFPFFPHFPPAPGLIPPPIGHPLFPRFPLTLGKNLPHPAMPNLPLPPPLFMQPRAEEIPEPKEKPVVEKPAPVIVPAMPLVLKTDKSEKPQQIPAPTVKEKPGEKKLKEHKKKEKDKTKKKKDKKEKVKGKEKGERKKVKVENKEKHKDKLKDKKEKKDKKKEKEVAAVVAAAGGFATSASNKQVHDDLFGQHEEKGESGVPKITFRLAPASPRPPTPDAQPRKIVIKPVVKNQDEGNKCPASEMVKREPSPELARISALITRPPKQKPAKSEKREGCLIESTPSPLAYGPKPAPVGSSACVDSKNSIAAKPGHHRPAGHKKKIGQTSADNDGNKVWICPACGGQDDGSPMIGCDDCDAWYHWVCVGIQVPPDENEDWYCRVCIVKKQENIADKKKKSRKKKTVT